jgi:hypothetical protein
MHDKNMTLIIAKVDVGFVRPDDFFPVLAQVVLVELCPGHASQAMVSRKEWNFSRHTIVFKGPVWSGFWPLRGLDQDQDRSLQILKP